MTGFFKWANLGLFSYSKYLVASRIQTQISGAVAESADFWPPTQLPLSDRFSFPSVGDQEVEAAPAACQVVEGPRQEPGGDQQLARAVGQGRAKPSVVA